MSADVYYSKDGYFLAALHALLAESREFAALPAADAAEMARVMAGLYEGDSCGLSMREFAADWAPRHFESVRALKAIAARDSETGRGIAHRFPVQPGLAVAVEDNLNILLEVTDTGGLRLAAPAVGNVGKLKDALDLARVWVAGAEDDLRRKRMAGAMAKRRPR